MKRVKVGVKKNSTKNKDKETIEFLKESLARALADYDNLQKRVERERQEYGKLANLQLVARLLPVYDQLEGAQDHLKDSGLAITIEEFEKVLEEEGIEKIEASTDGDFNEEVHEAVEIEKVSAKGDGKITKVLLSGWKLVDGPIVRPAKVKVGKKGK